jgi:hypothetical protein
VTSIGSYAFYSNQLTSVTIDSEAVLSLAPFAGNTITTLVIGNSVTSIGDFAFYNNQLTSVTIGNSVTSIGNYAFGYNQLTSVTIPDSVTDIGSYAFGYNQLTTVTIPNSVTSIGNGAFGSNQLLETVNCNVEQSAFVGSNALYYTASPLTIHARATDGTWTAGEGLTFQGNENVTVIKDL